MKSWESAFRRTKNCPWVPALDFFSLSNTQSASRVSARDLSVATDASYSSSGSPYPQSSGRQVNLIKLQLGSTNFFSVHNRNAIFVSSSSIHFPTTDANYKERPLLPLCRVCTPCVEGSNLHSSIGWSSQTRTFQLIRSSPLTECLLSLAFWHTNTSLSIFSSYFHGNYSSELACLHMPACDFLFHLPPILSTISDT